MRKRSREFLTALVVSGMLLSVRLQLSHAQPAAAERRVVLLNADPSLVHATQAVLAAWRIAVIALDDPALVARDARALGRVRELARDRAAEAVVWLVREPAGRAISVYDNQSDHVIGTRSLPATPLDAAAAAAAALSIKTLLRHEGQPEPAAAAGPNSEPEQPEPPASRAAPARVETDQSMQPRAAPGAGTVPSAPPSAQPSAPPAAEPVPPAAPARAETVEPGGKADDANPRSPATTELDVVAAAGARSAFSSGRLEARFGLAAVLWPIASAWGLGVDLSSGPGYRTARAGLNARLVDSALGASFLLRARPTPSWSAAAVAGPALHLALLRGTLAGSSAQATRVTPQLRLELRVEWRVRDVVLIGAWAQAELALLSQRYWVGEQLALESRRVSFAAWLAVGVPVRW